MADASGPRSTPIGIVSLTLADLAPPDFVETAAAAGYDFVGLGVVPDAAGRGGLIGSDAPVRETRQRLRDRGLYVRDVQFVALDAGVSAERWTPVLEIGARLGATELGVIVRDGDAARLADNLAALTRDAHAHGLQPMLEAVSYSPVRTIAQAAGLAREAGCAVMFDPLHLQRSGGRVDDLRGLEPGLTPFVQLCDAPLDVPQDLPSADRVPPGQRGGGSVPHLEALAFRELPGEGELPLAEMLAVLPAGTPVSVETPSVLLSGELGPPAFAVRAREGAENVLARVRR